MKVTSKIRYALIALKEIYETGEGVPCTSKDIAKKYSLSQKYLEKILRKLEKCCITEGKRGPNGGYCVKKDFSSITLFDIVTSIEEKNNFISCDKYKGDCVLNENCEFSKIWNNLNKMVEDYLSSIKLIELFEKKEVS